MNPLREAIMKHVYVDDYGCWMWTGAHNRYFRKKDRTWCNKGPRMKWEQRTVNPRRELYALHTHARLPAGSRLVASECGEVLCINPAHMGVLDNAANE